MIPVILIAILIELALSPRLDITKERKVLLWTGRRKRTYTYLFTL